MTNLEILKAMRQLLDKPESWHQGWYSADEKGKQCYLASACKFCLVGAYMKVSNRYWVDLEFSKLFDKKIGSIPAWNDAKERTHTDVIRLLDEMIAEQNA